MWWQSSTRYSPLDVKGSYEISPSVCVEVRVSSHSSHIDVHGILVIAA